MTRAAPALLLVALSLGAPTAQGEPLGRRADEGGVGIVSGTSVATLAPVSYGFPGVASGALEAFRIDGDRRAGLRLEGFGGYASGAQAGLFAERVFAASQHLRLYVGGGAGFGGMAIESSLLSWSGPHVYVEPIAGMQLSLHRIALTAELFYNLPFGPGLPIGDYLGRSGIRVGVALGRFGSLPGTRAPAKAASPPPTQQPREAAPLREPPPIPPPPPIQAPVPPAPPAGSNPPPPGGTPQRVEPAPDAPEGGAPPHPIDAP